MSNVLTQVHSSGRWDRPERLLREDVEEWIKDWAPDVITATEAGDFDRGDALDAPGYVRCQVTGGGRPGADECAVALSRETMRLVHFEAAVVTRERYRQGTGKLRAPLNALVVVGEHIETGVRICLGVIHLPSSVQDGDEWARGPRVAAYRSAVRGLKKLVHRIAKRYKALPWITADWNLDLGRLWVRAYLHGIWPGKHFTWSKKDAGGEGTHGPRLIDFSVLSRRLRVTFAKVLASVRSSDHRPFVQRVALPT